MKNGFLIFVLSLFSAPVWALDFTSTALQLNCPSRGKVEITLHVYGHVSILWKDNYEVGAGHRVRDGVEFVTFANGDLFIHKNTTNEYFLRYSGTSALQRCMVLSEAPVYVYSLPYQH